MPAAQGRGRRRAWPEAPAGQEASRAAQLRQLHPEPARGPAVSLTPAFGAPHRELIPEQADPTAFLTPAGSIGTERPRGRA